MAVQMGRFPFTRSLSQDTGEPCSHPRGFQKSLHPVPGPVPETHSREKSRACLLCGPMPQKRWERKAGSVGIGTALVTLSFNGFKTGGQWEGNKEAVLVLMPLKGAGAGWGGCSVNLSLLGLNLACDYFVFGVLSLPSISQSRVGGVGGLCAPWGVAGLQLPTMYTGPWSDSRKKLSWGWKRKGRLGLECGPGYHLYPPLPGLKALPGASQVILRHSYSLCLYEVVGVGGQGVEGARSESLLLSSLMSSAGVRVGAEGLQASWRGPLVLPASFTSSSQPA